MTTTPRLPRASTPDFAAIYRRAGMDGHAAIESYVAIHWSHLSGDARSDFADGLIWGLRLVAACPEVLGALAVAVREGDLRDPLLPTEAADWEASIQREAARLLAVWDRPCAETEEAR